MLMLFPALSYSVALVPIAGSSCPRGRGGCRSLERSPLQGRRDGHHQSTRVGAGAGLLDDRQSRPAEASTGRLVCDHAL